MARSRVGCHPGRQGKRDKIGYDYVHSLIDDYPGWATPKSCPTRKGPTCADFLERARRTFAAQGITVIERVMTDNAFAHRHVKRVCAALGAKQKFIKPHCPWQNGKVERLNRTLATEWPRRQVFTSNQARTDAPAPGSSTTTMNAVTAHSEENPHQSTVTNDGWATPRCSSSTG